LSWGKTKKSLEAFWPTGLDFGPDGALYVADWIDGWSPKGYGRIWKLDDKSGAALPQRQQIKTLLAANFSDRKEEDLNALLKNQDMRVRLKAQFELVKRGEAGAAVFQKALGQTAEPVGKRFMRYGVSAS
jgi:hypothetical protein